MTSTVKPVIDTVIEKGTPVVTSAIAGAISVVERIDPDAKQREAYFTASAATGEEEKGSGERADAAKPQQDQTSLEQPQPSVEERARAADGDAFSQLKMVSEDLLDLWLYEGSKGVAYVQASKAYQLTDPYVHYV